MKSEPDEHDNSPGCRQTEQRIKVICEDKTFIFWKNDLIKASAFFAEKVKNSTELRLVDRKDRVKTFQEFVEAQLASVPASNSFSTSLHDKHLICGDGCRYQFSYDAVWRDIDIYTFGTKYGISSLANYYLARLRCRLWIIHVSYWRPLIYRIFRRSSGFLLLGGLKRAILEEAKARIGWRRLCGLLNPMGVNRSHELRWKRPLRISNRTCKYCKSPRRVARGMLARRNYAGLEQSIQI
jgi:hypothetical protein